MNPLESKIAELAARFDARAPAERSSLAAAIADGDRQAVAMQAHKLAGTAGMFGHDDIGAAALALEEAAEGGDDMAPLAARLDRLLAQLGS